VAVVALALLAATAVSRYTPEAGLQRDNFWATKLAWQHCADCVLAGDSRVGTGLSPAAMAPWLPGQRIVNFGFNSACYSARYLDALAAVLDPAAGQRVVVLGITPMSLLPTSGRPTGYEQCRADTATLSWIELLSLRTLRFAEPMRIDTVAEQLNPRRPRAPVTTYWPDGWTAYSPPRGRRFVLQLLEATFANQKVAPETIGHLLERVHAWTAAGLRVYAFRPPTCSETVAVEDQISGFDESAFIHDFEAVGGFWLSVDPLAYDCADGSHLYPTAAVQLSRDVAAALVAQKNPPRRGGAGPGLASPSKLSPNGRERRTYVQANDRKSRDAISVPNTPTDSCVRGSDRIADIQR
jgi:hypothetical protein